MNPQAEANVACLVKLHENALQTCYPRPLLFNLRLVVVTPLVIILTLFLFSQHQYISCSVQASS